MVDCEKRGGAGIWTTENTVETLDSGDLDDAERHFLDVAGDPSMSSVVIEVGNSDNLSREALDHVDEEWTALGEETDLAATAWVADRLSRLATSQKNEAEGTEPESSKTWTKQSSGQASFSPTAADR